MEEKSQEHNRPAPDIARASAASDNPPKGLVDLAQVATPNRCIYCQSEEIVKRGKRQRAKTLQRT